MVEKDAIDDPTGTNHSTPLRRGWTTGACAAAGARAAIDVLLGREAPASVVVPLPGGRRPSFAVAATRWDAGGAEASIVKDAGDDPDVTHGATIVTRVAPGAPGTGLVFRAGEGVGTATRPGLPIEPGEPAINPGPRAMIAAALAEGGAPADLVVTIAIPGGERLAERTLNGRLGIVGGLSILGTTGIVIPFSCAAWIDTIHRGIDVARACGLGHVVGATGTTSEAAAQARFCLEPAAMIEMGDFVGGFLKYLRRHPVARVTIAGGFAKMTKLSQGLLDLHSRRGVVDADALASLAERDGAPADVARRIAGAPTGAEALLVAQAASFDLAALVAREAAAVATAALAHDGIALDVAVVARDGRWLAQTGAAAPHSVR